MPTMAQCQELLREASQQLSSCPCCGGQAQMVSYDFLTITASCQNLRCRLKLERGVVNSRTFQRCVKMVLRAWNRRNLAPKEKRFVKELATQRSISNEDQRRLRELSKVRSPIREQH